MSLKSAVDLDIPDIIHLHGKPMTLSELISELPINHSKASCVHRLMRILIHSGFFTAENVKGESKDDDEEEAYKLTPACKLLLKNEPMSVAPFLLAMLDPFMTNPWQKLSEWFQNDDQTPFVTTYGKLFFELTGQQPRVNMLFNEAMASDARLVGKVIIEEYKNVFEGINSFLNVGGGTGAMGKAIADAFPNMKCTVLDLPHVVNGLDRYKNLDFVAGDMLKSIPPADAVLLKMLLAKGKERTEKEWVKLFHSAGFSEYKITPIFGLRSLIEISF